MAVARSRLRPRATLAAVFALLCGVLAACSGAPPNTLSGGPVRIVAAENFWGSIASQLGAGRVQVTSVIANPQTDPHDYEPTPADARLFASANLVIVNGLGYDPWAEHLLSATTRAPVLNVGRLLGRKDGDNPHLWYDPVAVHAFVNEITRMLQRIDPAHASEFEHGRARFLTNGLKQYDSLITEIGKRYAGTPVGASESVFAALAPALKLKVLTPPRFLAAISEGSDVTAADKTAIDRQIARREIRLYVYNSQNTTPDIAEQLRACRREGIPTATITETPVPASATFQAWQTGQLRGILAGLEKATAR